MNRYSKEAVIARIAADLAQKVFDARHKATVLVGDTAEITPNEVDFTARAEALFESTLNRIVERSILTFEREEEEVNKRRIQG